MIARWKYYSKSPKMAGKKGRFVTVYPTKKAALRDARLTRGGPYKGKVKGKRFYWVRK